MFSGLKFRGKLALAIVPAMLAIVVLAWASVAPRLGRSSDASRDSERAGVARLLMESFDELQFEAGLSALVAGGAESGDELAAQRAVVDDRVRSARASLASASIDTSAGAVADYLAFLDGLGDLRASLTSPSEAPDVDATVEAFDDGLDSAVSAIRDLTFLTDDADLLRTAGLLVDQLVGKEKYGEALARVGGLFQQDQIDPVEAGDIRDETQEKVNAYQAFAEVAGADDLALLESVQTSPAVASLDEQILAIISNAAEGQATDADGGQWWAASAAAIGAYDTLDDGLFDRYVERADGVRSDSRRSALLYLALAAIASLIAAGVAFIVGRDLVRRLGKITGDARTIAVDRLPEVLEALRNPTPEALAGALPRVESPSTDEIGSLAESFNSVLRTSVETSIEHSTKRAETLTNLLINLGRRNQSIIERQLQLIDSLESRQQDPEVLDGLFKLDHLVTRQRRNAESLLVLAGSRRSRAWTAPVAVSDVIRGAISEVADMGRVNSEIPGGQDLMVSGQYAVDLSHLLAELIENATLYSNPSTQVVVRGQRSGLSMRLWVIDNGVGMSDEEVESANVRVSDPPDIDEITTDQVGFQVVGRLGRRLEARVRLQNNPAGGIAVSLDLPPQIFEHDDRAGAGRTDAAEGAAEDDQMMIADHGDDFDFGDLSDDRDFDQELEELVFAEQPIDQIPVPSPPAAVAEPARSVVATPTASWQTTRDDSGPIASVAPVDVEPRHEAPVVETPLPRRRTEVSTSPVVGSRPVEPVRAAAPVAGRAPARPGRQTDAPTIRIVEAPAKPAVAPVEPPREQTAAGLVKRRPGAALNPERSIEPVGLFKGGDTPVEDGQDDLAESRLRSLRAFTRGVDQGRGDA